MFNNSYLFLFQMIEKIPSVFDIGAGKDTDDTGIAIIVARNPERYNPVLMITNDEALTYGRARFLYEVVNLTGFNIKIAAGLPSTKQRKDTLVERNGLVSTSGQDFRGDGFETLVETLDQYEKINYFGLGALTNLAAALKRHPEFASKINLIQMGMNFNGAYSRSTPQYNVRIDIQSFKDVLERVSNPRFLMIHTSWGAYSANENSRQQLGVYIDDPLYNALKESENPALNLFAKHLEVWVKDGKPCSIMHDPLTVLSFYEDIVDYIEGDIVFSDNGLVDLTKESHEELRKLPPERVNKLSDYLEASRVIQKGLVKRVEYSLNANYDAARASFINALFGNTKPSLATEWKEYNASH